jgi:hypothetical protein
MANQLKVTNIATGQSWMKTPDEIKVMKANKTLSGRFKFEKEADSPPLANKIAPPAQPAPAPSPKPADAPKPADQASEVPKM